MTSDHIKQTTHGVFIRLPNESFAELWKIACAEHKAPGKIAKRMLIEKIDEASKGNTR